MKKIVVNKENSERVENNLVDVENSEPVKVVKETPKIDKSSKTTKTIYLEKEDFSLEKEGEFFTSKKAKKYQVKFASTFNQEEVLTLTKDNQPLKMRFLGKKEGTKRKGLVKGRTNQNQMLYVDVEQGVDLIYQCQKKGIKESLVIKEKQDTYDFDFVIDIGELTPEFNSTNNVLELKKEGKVIYRILSPYMEDNNKVRSDNCKYSIDEEGGLLKVSLHVDEEWINDEKRAFPVVVDPTIEVVSSSLFEIIPLVDAFPSTEVGDLVLGKVESSETTTYYALKVNVNMDEIRRLYGSIASIQFKLRTHSLADSTNLNSDRYVLMCNDEVVRTVTKKEIEHDLVLDFTLQMWKMKVPTLTLILADPGDQILDVQSPTQNVIDSRVNFYNLDEEDVTKQPCLVVECEDHIESEPVTKDYPVGRAGTTSVDVMTGRFWHVHPNAISIKEGGLSLSLAHVYDGRRLFEGMGFGRGWKSNFHQFLFKNKGEFDGLDYQEIVYVDGEGKKHFIHERWYYLEGNEKVYISRDDVYLDAKQKLKYKKDSTHTYDVECEFINDDKLTYVSGMNISSFNKENLKASKFYLSCGYGPKEISVLEGKQHLQFYYYSSQTGNKVYITPDKVIKGPEGYLCTTNGDVVNIDQSYENIITKTSSGKYTVKFKKTTFTGPQDGPSFVNQYTTVYVVEEKRTSGEAALDDVYRNEDIFNLDDQIESIKDYIEELTASKASTVRAYKTLLKQFIGQVQSYIDQKKMIGHETTLRNIQDQLQDIQKDFYIDIGNHFLEKAAGSYGDDFNSNLEYIGTSTDPKADAAKNILQAFNYLYERKSNILTAGASYVNAQDEYERINDELRDIQLDSSIASITNQLLTYDEELGKVTRQLEDYTRQLEALKSQRQALVDEQKKKVNDFITDQEGNTLGFDGYGRLVLIQDKYENAIQIEFGYEKENKDQMLSIYSKHQRISFNYNSNSGLLESIIDPQGRRISFAYDDMSQLISIIYPDRQETSISYDSGFEIISPLAEKTQLSSEGNTLSVKCFYCDQIIGNNKIVAENSNFIRALDELYIFHPELHQMVLRDQIRFFNSFLETLNTDYVYSFDKEGHLIHYKGKEEIEGYIYQDKELISEFIYKKEDEQTPLAAFDASSLDHDFEENTLPASNLLGFVIDKRNINTDVSEFVIKITFKDNRNEPNWVEEYTQTISSLPAVLPVITDCSKIRLIEIEFSSEDPDFLVSDLASVKLIKLKSGALYEYDQRKRLVKEQDGYHTITYSDFNEKDIPLTRKETSITGEELTTYYSYNDQQLLTCISDSHGNVIEYYYDEKGNCLEKRSYNKKDASLMKVERMSYDEQGRPLSSLGPIKGPDGIYPQKEISYIPGTDIQCRIKEANGESLCYQYDFNNGDLLSISSSAKGNNNSTVFSYNYGLLTSMSHHGVRVDYAYDGKKRKTKVFLNGNEYARYLYRDWYFSQNDANYPHPEMIEGSEDEPEGSYPEPIEFGSAVETHISTGLDIGMYRNEAGQLLYVRAKGNDVEQEITQRYDGDRLKSIRSVIKGAYSSGQHEEWIENTYNEFGEITEQKKKFVEKPLVETPQEEQQFILSNSFDSNHLVTASDMTLSYGNNEDRHCRTANTYDENHNLQLVELQNKVVGDNDSISYVTFEAVDIDYDSLGRIKHQKVHSNKVSLCHEYSYLQQDESSLDYVCEDITKIQFDNEGQTTYLTETDSYEYDVNGNIIRITSDDNITRYQYDELNRLIREDNPYLKETYIYHYDRAGNIIYKRSFDYNTVQSELPTEPKLIEFIYDCDNRDQLISFNGQRFKYDEAGRPTTYKNVKFTWNDLNQLVGIGDNISYMYDTNGFIRKKIVGSDETMYITNGTQILSMKTGEVTLIFRYVLNKLIGFQYNKGVSTKEYIYQRNAFGDIIGIFDDEGNQVGGYAYDAYGNCAVTVGKDGVIAPLNPFRYRGYFWDDDAQLYYLNSRYYDPETGRFISPDTLAILDETKGQINGLNLYMYCKNNPVMYSDESGYMPKWLGNLLKGLCIIVGTALFVVAIVASAGSVGALVGVGAAAMGLSTTTVSTMITFATISTYVVAGGVALFGVSDAIEVFSGGINPVRDYIFGGDQKLYDTTKTVFNVLGTIAVISGIIGPKVIQSIAKRFGKPKLSKSNDIAGYYKDFFDNNAYWGLRIDATTHGNQNSAIWHHNPHIHVVNRGGHGISVYYLWEVIKKWLGIK